MLYIYIYIINEIGLIKVTEEVKLIQFPGTLIEAWSLIMCQRQSGKVLVSVFGLGGNEIFLISKILRSIYVVTDIPNRTSPQRIFLSTYMVPTAAKKR